METPSKNNSLTDSPLADIVDSLDIAIWELDSSFRVRKYNRKAKEIYGEDVIGNFCYQAAAGLNKICHDCPAEKVLEGHQCGRSQHTRVTASGKTITIDHTATPLKNEAGEINGFVVSIVDITHLKNVELELKEHQLQLEELVTERTRALQKSELRYRVLYEKSKLQEELYRSILHSSSDAIVVYNIISQVNYLNPTFSRMFGWTLDELQGRRIPFIPESERETSMQLITDLIDKGTPYHAFRTKRLTKTGQLKDISLSASRYANHRGQPAGMLVILRDISEQARTEQEILKIRKLESVGILAGGIAHDFNNILTAILGNISLVQMLTDEKDKTRKFLLASEKACFRAKALTQQLLTFAKGGEPIKKLASIEEIIREATIFVSGGSNVRCDFHFPQPLKPVIIDADQMSQVVQNIIINAQQAMPNGGVIKISGENYKPKPQDKLPNTASDYVKISIQDQGCGIPAAILDRIFDPYFTTKAKGSGLGLAITHSIVRKHNSDIMIDSIEGQGCTVTIHLPAVETNLPDNLASEPAKPTLTPSNTTIIIMDDEEIIRDVVGDMLSHKGYKVLLAQDGKETIRLYKKTLSDGSPAELIIMDLTIPGGMGGRETVQEILKLNLEAKVIVASGYANDPIMANFKEYGFSAAINKPFNLQELTTIIDKMLSN